MEKWTDSWAINSYATNDEFHSDLAVAGFTNINATDITSHVEPSIRRLYLSFFPGMLTNFFGRLVGLRNQTQSRNTWSAYYQYKTHRKNLWRYYIYSAEKP